jgi:hypothetical protein
VRSRTRVEPARRCSSQGKPSNVDRRWIPPVSRSIRTAPEHVNLSTESNTEPIGIPLPRSRFFRILEKPNAAAGSPENAASTAVALGADDVRGNTGRDRRLRG